MSCCFCEPIKTAQSVGDDTHAVVARQKLASEHGPRTWVWSNMSGAASLPHGTCSKKKEDAGRSERKAPTPGTNSTLKIRKRDNRGQKTAPKYTTETYVCTTMLSTTELLVMKQIPVKTRQTLKKCCWSLLSLGRMCVCVWVCVSLCCAELSRSIRCCLSSCASLQVQFASSSCDLF